MADISHKITRRSIKAKKKAAIKTIKTQAKEKIREVKIQYANNPERKQAKIQEKEQKKALRIQKANARIAYNSRQPKQYSLGEEIFNSISHGIGAGLAASAIVLFILRVIAKAPEAFVWTLSLYTVCGAMMFIMYLMSTFFHALSPYGAKKVFRILNYDLIFAFIASIYSVLILKTASSAVLIPAVAVTWVVAAALIALNSVFELKLRKLFHFIIFVLVIGAGFGFTFSPAGNAFGEHVKVFILCGLGCYLVGTFFFLRKNHKWSHSIFHIFALAGSVMHFFALYYMI